MRALPLVAASILAPLGAQQPHADRAAGNADYVVLAAVKEGDPYDASAQTLAGHHHAKVVRFDPADLEPVRKALLAAMPRNVALVMRPEQIDFAFARRFLQLATELDDDPFVDFAFGYITGSTADDAKALAEAGVARKPKAAAPKVATVAGGCPQSMAATQPYLLRRKQLDAIQLYCAGGDRAGGERAGGEKAGGERDRAFLKEQLPRLQGRDVVTFVGHGYPREVVGGPSFAELASLRLDGAVVLNVACYTGVTQRFFEDDYQTTTVRGREVPQGESFCLALLHTGVVGYTAYLCPRPAGPELDTDLAALAADGSSLGDARRRDYDKTVLGFLGFGEERLRLEPVADGTKFAPNRDAVRDMMLEGATGGVLFGDPACVPFAARAGEAPVAIDVDADARGLRVRAKAAGDALFLQCNDPTASFGKSMAMKVYARVPLGDRQVEDVVVDELKVGRAPQPSRVLWAVEQDHGERFLQLKVNFARSDHMGGDLALTTRVITTSDASKARTRGGEVQRRPAASKDVRSRQAEPFMIERAAARQVPREVLQAALDASAQLIGDREVAAGATERLAAFGSEGFRAVCALIEVGHAHYRTWELLRATWHPGDERHLLALAAGPELPNFASWTVFEGLGAADTPEVRAWLQARLRDEPDAGIWMAVAKGLAHLGDQGAAKAIGARVLEARTGWDGVEPHLIDALAELGGPDAIAALEKIAAKPDGRHWQPALSALERLQPEAAARARAARGAAK